MKTLIVLASVIAVGLCAGQWSYVTDPKAQEWCDRLLDLDTKFNLISLPNGCPEIVSVQQQVVAGMNYRYVFKQNGQTCELEYYEIPWMNQRTINKDSCNMAVMHHNDRQIPGGYSVQDASKQEYTDLLATFTTMGLLKQTATNDYNVMKVETQVVSGVNYRYTLSNGQGHTCMMVLYVQSWTKTYEVTMDGCHLKPHMKKQLGGLGVTGGYSVQDASKQEYTDLLATFTTKGLLKQTATNDYNIMKVETQVVSGMNYKYTLSNGQGHTCMMVLYVQSWTNTYEVTMDGCHLKPHMKKQLAGGWAVQDASKQEYTDVLNTFTKMNLLTATNGYTVVAVETQVVAGENYRYTLSHGHGQTCMLELFVQLWTNTYRVTKDECNLSVMHKRQLGGFQVVNNVDDAGVQACVGAMLDSINMQSNSMFRMVESAVSAQYKVVQGIEYKLTLTAVESSCMNSGDSTGLTSMKCPVNTASNMMGTQWASTCWYRAWMTTPDDQVKISNVHMSKDEDQKPANNVDITIPDTVVVPLKKVLNSKILLGGDTHDYKSHGKKPLGMDKHDYIKHMTSAKLGNGDYVVKVGRKLLADPVIDVAIDTGKKLLGQDGHDLVGHLNRILGKDGHDLVEHTKNLLGGGDDHDLVNHVKDLLGKDGHDLVNHGVDKLLGQDGHDLVNHISKNLLGGDNHDLVNHGTKNLIGGDGHDLVNHGTNNLIGGDGHDLVNHGTNNLIGGDGHDLVNHGTNNLIGGDGHDLVNHGTNNLIGGDGHDLVNHGTNNLIGGDGHDDCHIGMFKEFQAKFNKLYGSPKEEEKRYMVFCDNMRTARKLQQTEKGTAKYGATKFADLTKEEFKQYVGKPWNVTANHWMKKADIPKWTAPDAFDWRDHGAVTPVKNQGSCGSCWAFSTTGNIEGQWAIKKKKLISLSEQELVDCDKVDEGCNGGLPSNAYKEIERLGGLETETDYSYKGEDEKCEFKKKEVKVYINDSLSISSDEKEMASWLAANGPISIGINAFAMQFYMGGISHPWKIFCNPKNLDHGVLIVGYGVQGSEPYWIVKNSWGPDWGEKGYYLVYRGSGVCGLNTMCTSSVVD